MFEVRLVRADEVAEAGRVTASAWQPLGSSDDPDWLAFSAPIARDVAGRFRTTAVFVAIEEGQILGSVTLELNERIADDQNPTSLAPDEAHVRTLGVVPSARGRGVRTRLMEECLTVARERGKTIVTLNTSEGNAAAQGLYESMGFVRRPDVVPEGGSPLRAYVFKL